MQKPHTRIILAIIAVGLFASPAVHAATISERLSGRILLQVQAHGEAWYVNPIDEIRYYMKDGAMAYALLRQFGLGISEKDFTTLQTGDRAMTNRLKGRILLRVQQKGEAYYMNPIDGTLHYLKDGAAAYQIMRTLGLGITDADLTQIWAKTVSADAVSVPMGVPARLRIPAIRVDAVVEAVGLAADGSVGIPALPLETVWYDQGPRPGEAGSAVISGHVNWWGGLDAVFAHLHTLVPGDKVLVRDENGTVASFVVRETRIYGATDSVVDIFQTNDGISRLNLITCTGTWDKRTQQYSDRLVVFTEREAEERN